MIHAHRGEAVGAVAALAGVGGRNMVARLARSGRTVVTGGAVVGDRRVIHVGAGEAVGGMAGVALRRGHQVIARFTRRRGAVMTACAATSDQ